RDFDEVKAPQSLGAEELDIRAAAAEPLPRRQRQVLHAANPDAAIDPHALGLHEAVVGHRRALELAVSGGLAGFRFRPVRLIGSVGDGFPRDARSRVQWAARPFERDFCRARLIVYTTWKMGAPRALLRSSRSRGRRCPNSEVALPAAPGLGQELADIFQ